MMKSVSILFLSIALLGPTTTTTPAVLPGDTVLLALGNSLTEVGQYPTTVTTFPPAITRAATVAGIPVYLPRTLPTKPLFARVAAASGIHVVELSFLSGCNPGAHFCHYATLLSKTVMTLPTDVQPFTYKDGVSMYYHPPVCSMAPYCGDGGLYFKTDGVWHAIEAKGQRSVLEKIYDSYAKV